MTEPAEDLRAAAYHEAGHAVAAFLLGIRVERVSIVPDEASLGRMKPNAVFRRQVQGDWDNSARDRHRLEHRIIVVFAGLLAEAKAAGSEPDYSHVAASSDVRNITHFGDFVGLNEMHPDEQDAYLHWLQVRARLLVNDGWYLIERLAVDLLAKRTLSERAVVTLLRDTVLTNAKATMPAEQFGPSTVTINDETVTIPSVFDTANITAYGWRVLAWGVAARLRES